MDKSKQAPRISVVVPSYNYADYLRQRLDSVLSQEYRDIEVIVIDDASTDNSRGIIGEFRADPRIRTVFRDRNSGNLFLNWNLGVRMARGTYVWIAEADDVAEPGFLKVLSGQLDRNPSVGLAYCQSRKIDENGRILGSMLDHTLDLDRERWKTSFVNRGTDECARFLVYKNTIPNASAVLFRRDVYVRAGWADESIRYGNDWLTWVSMLQISDIVFEAEHLNFYRCHSRSVREEMDLSENEILGSYLVSKYILDRQTVEPALKRRMFQYRIRSWVNVRFRRGTKRTRGMGREIFRLAGTMDRLVYLRFFLELLVYPLRIIYLKIRSMGMKIKNFICGRPGVR